MDGKESTEHVHGVIYMERLFGIEAKALLGALEGVLAQGRAVRRRTPLLARAVSDQGTYLDHRGACVVCLRCVDCCPDSLGVVTILHHQHLPAV